MSSRRPFVSHAARRTLRGGPADSSRDGAGGSARAPAVVEVAPRTLAALPDRMPAALVGRVPVALVGLVTACREVLRCLWSPAACAGVTRLVVVVVEDFCRMWEVEDAMDVGLAKPPPPPAVLPAFIPARCTRVSRSTLGLALRVAAVMSLRGMFSGELARLVGCGKEVIFGYVRVSAPSAA